MNCKNFLIIIGAVFLNTFYSQDGNTSNPLRDQKANNLLPNVLLPKKIQIHQLTANYQQN